MGGTFDPPHLWHIAAATAARDVAGSAAWVLFVPAANSPLKIGGPVATQSDRIEMLRIATRSLKRSVIWTDECDRAKGGEPSYSIDTVERFRLLYQHATPRLCIGADQALAFHKWHRYRDLLAQAEPLVILREPATTRQALREQLAATGAWNEHELSQWERRIAPCKLAPISSTQIREMIAAGTTDLSPFIDSKVAEYIRKHGLYNAAVTA